MLLLSMPGSFEHMPSVAIRMPNGALASLAGNVDAHHKVAIADLVLVHSRVVETIEEISETNTARSGSSRRCVLLSELQYFSLRFFAERKASTTSPSGFDANRRRSAFTCCLTASKRPTPREDSSRRRIAASASSPWPGFNIGAARP